MERLQEELRADRDEAIRTASAGGMTDEQIAEVLGMSRQRVSQIAHG